MEIENFKLIDFFNQNRSLIDNYVVALRYVKPIKTKREVFQMKMKHVELIKQTIGSGNDRDLIKIVSKVQKCSEDEVLEMQIIQFFGIINSIKEQLMTIVRAEENGLTPSDVNMKWEQVGGSERMEKFGIINTLDKLTGKKPHLHKVYLNMKYSEIFTILLKWKTEAEIQKEMNQIKTK